jgi:hypothetical protein
MDEEATVGCYNEDEQPPGFASAARLRRDLSAHQEDPDQPI